MKVRYLKLKNWLIATLMGTLGLAGCHCHKQIAEPEPEPKPVARPDEPVRLMYGVPTMDFQLRGEVRNPQGKPIRNVRINMLERNMELQGTQLQGDPEAIDRWLQGTEVSTDSEGRFELKSSGLPQDTVRLLIRDADGKENGTYQDRVVVMPVDRKDVDATKAGGWYQGTFNKEISIELEKK